MALVVNAVWTVKPGSLDVVLEALSELAKASRAEPGCLYYMPYRDIATPQVVRIFEVYADEDAFRAHSQSPHFRTIALARAVPELEKRERAIFETIDV
jgi:quinol monooxygenase YgiN